MIDDLRLSIHLTSTTKGSGLYGGGLYGGGLYGGGLYGGGLHGGTLPTYDSTAEFFSKCILYGGT